MYSTMYAESTADHVGRKSIYLWRRYARKTFIATLTFDLKFASVQSYACTKLEFFYGFFISWKSEARDLTDRWTECNTY